MNSSLKKSKNAIFNPSNPSTPALICRIPTLSEMNQKWDYEIERSKKKQEQANWIIWKEQAIQHVQKGNSIPYYGFLGDTIICEATALFHPDCVQNAEGLVNASTAYLCAFRTVKEHQGKGYFSSLFWYMIEDLKKRGIRKVTVGVEPTEVKNKQIYVHYGFTEFIKQAQETYPDGTVIEVEYYGMDIS